jgi:major membrane immunogen (membrane-anchored lipoprotein)
MTRSTLWTTLAMAVLLTACGEKAQTAATHKADGKPWEGAQSAFTAPGWQAGDRASWEAQMKSRSQGQNEYSRAPAQR